MGKIIIRILRSILEISLIEKKINKIIPNFGFLIAWKLLERSVEKNWKFLTWNSLIRFYDIDKNVQGLKNVEIWWKMFTVYFRIDWNFSSLFLLFSQELTYIKIWRYSSLNKYFPAIMQQHDTFLYCKFVTYTLTLSEKL